MSLLDKIKASLEKDAKVHENASTQIDLPPAAAARMLAVSRKLVPDEDLAGDGRETRPHVTIKYGVREDEATLKATVSSRMPFQIALGRVMVFTPGESSKGAAPIVVEAFAKQLKGLHDAVGEAMGVRPDDFPYVPHVTVAYVRPEEAEKYAGDDSFAGMTFEATAVTLSKHDDDDQVKLPLGKAAPLPPSGRSFRPSRGCQRR